MFLGGARCSKVGIRSCLIQMVICWVRFLCLLAAQTAPFRKYNTKHKKACKTNTTSQHARLRKNMEDLSPSTTFAPACTRAHTHTHTRTCTLAHKSLHVTLTKCKYAHTHMHELSHMYLHTNTHAHTFKVADAALVFKERRAGH
jgi:hypothetical protein